MSKLKSHRSQTQVIILTGHASIETAVEATRRGAFHFVTKPCNLDEILSLADRALSHTELEIENHLHQRLQLRNFETGFPPVARHQLSAQALRSPCPASRGDYTSVAGRRLIF